MPRIHLTKETENPSTFVSPPTSATGQTITEPVAATEEVTAPPKSTRRIYRRTLRILRHRIKAWRQRFWFFKRVRNTRISILLTCLLFLVLGWFFGTLATAVVQFWNKTIDKNAETLLVRIAPQLAQAIVFAVGGAVGIWQWNRTYAQKQEEIKLKETELDKRTKEFEDKQELDILNAEKKEQQDRFADIQNRFASTDTSIRANAALRLAEFARTPRPRKTSEQLETPNLPVDETNNPYFLQAASQLATALHIEANAAVRESIVEALRNMTTWDKLPDDNILRTKLIDRLVHANRTAKDNFIVAFAAWSVVSTEWKAWKTTTEATAKVKAKRKAFSFPVALTLFCNTPEKTMSTLETLMLKKASGSEGAKFAVAQWVHIERRKVMTEVEKLQDTAQRLPSLEATAGILTDSRKALEEALKSVIEIRKIVFILSSCFLAGAKIPNLVLTAGNLRNTILTGADLTGVDLSKAKLYKVSLAMATLHNANLTEADLSYAKLTEADLSRATLNGAKVGRSNLDQAKVIPPTWEQADYKDYFGKEDTELRQRVQEAYLRQPEELRKQMEEYERRKAAQKTRRSSAGAGHL
jgi:Skp family chaperone for outer membrane proteins